MELGLSSASFYPNVNTEDSIKLMSSLGFNAGELFLNCPFEYTDSFTDVLLEEKLKHNFNIKSVHSFAGPFEPYLFDRYKRRRDDMFKHFKDLCSAGKKLGAECYTFHGHRLADLQSLDIKFITDVYNELAYIASEKGIKLAQENVFWCMSSNLEFLKILKEKVAQPLYFTLDIKQAHKAKLKPSQYIDIMGSELVNLHLNDNDASSSCLLPGKGTVDFKELNNLLSNVSYKGIGTIEVYSENYENYNDIIVSKQILEDIFT